MKPSFVSWGCKIEQEKKHPIHYNWFISIVVSLNPFDFAVVG